MNRRPRPRFAFPTREVPAARVAPRRPPADYAAAASLSGAGRGAGCAWADDQLTEASGLARNKHLLGPYAGSF
ncbi:hypothetical protein GCM10027048_21120 [Hymenobacter coalescens]